jgi:hypothetical protein
LSHIITVRGQWAGKSNCLEALITGTNPTKETIQTLKNRRPDPMDVCQIMPTGGTTGMPKAAPRTHNDYLVNVEYHSRAWEITSNDTLLVVTPVGHGMAMHWGIGAAFFSYAKLVLLDSVRPEDICEAIQREKVTAIPTVPALVARIVNMEDLGKYDLSSLKKLSVDITARMSLFMFRHKLPVFAFKQPSFYPYYVQLIVAGYDTSGPAIFDLDPVGGTEEEKKFFSTGWSALWGRAAPAPISWPSPTRALRWRRPAGNSASGTSCPAFRPWRDRPLATSSGISL